MTDSKPVIVKLVSPVEDFGQTIDSVTIHRHAVGADLRRMAGLSEEDQTLLWIEILCALEPGTVDKMRTSDIEALSVAIYPFVHRTLPSPNRYGEDSP